MPPTPEIMPSTIREISAAFTFIPESPPDTTPENHSRKFSKYPFSQIDELTERMRAAGFKSPNYRWHALKLLEQDEEIMGQVGMDFTDIVDRSYETDIINENYPRKPFKEIFKISFQPVPDKKSQEKHRCHNT